MTYYIIAAMLALIAYSINDAVVVFYRLRMNMKEKTPRTQAELCARL